MTPARISFAVAVLVFLTGGVTSHVLHLLMDDIAAWVLTEAPETASSGQWTDDHLADYGLDAFDRRKARASEFYDRLKAIKRGDLPQTMVTDYDVTEDKLKTFIEGYKWRFFGPLTPIDYLSRSFRFTVIKIFENAPLRTKQDVFRYLSRLSCLGIQARQLNELLLEAVRRDRTMNALSVAAIPGMIDNYFLKPIDEMPIITRLNTSLNDNSQLSDVQKKAYIDLAVEAVRLEVIPAFQKLKYFFEKDYLNHTRSGLGVSSWEGGRAYYEACLRWHLSISMTAEEVHQMGLEEVERITGYMKEITERMNLTGIGGFFKHVRTSPRLMLRKTEAIMDSARDIIFNRIKPVIMSVFRNVPDLPLEVRAVDSDGSVGSYIAPVNDGPGIFEVNALNDKMWMSFMLPSLILHETYPGHHMEASYRSLLDIKDFRRKDKTEMSTQREPFAFPGYTAFGEGWGLYAEYLGDELEIYKDDYERMGRYMGELVRACRLVIDTGLHAFGWSKQRAITYLHELTSLDLVKSEREINRYVTNPGQACAYKVGELKIRQLRAKAESELGAVFNIQDFHEIVLKEGRVPLWMLERSVYQWIERSRVVTPSDVSMTTRLHMCSFSLALLMALLWASA